MRAGRSERAKRGLDRAAFDLVRNAIAASGTNGLAEMLTHWHTEEPTVVVGRPFCVHMAPRTVLRLSDTWHDRAAEAEAANVSLPQPWYRGDTVNGYQIEPITTAVELSRYAHALHNCAGPYAHEVARGDCYVYIVLKDSKPVAMLDLARTTEQKPQLRQLVSQCNGRMNKRIESSVRSWLRQRRKAEGDGHVPVPRRATVGVLDDFDDAVPF